MHALCQINLQRNSRAYKCLNLLLGMNFGGVQPLMGEVGGGWASQFTNFGIFRFILHLGIRVAKGLHVLEQVIFSRLARKLTARSTHKQHHHAAVMTRGGAIVAVGYNRGQEHAEMRAKRLCRHPNNLTLYSFRFTKGGKWAMAKPCEDCQKALKGIKIYYTNERGELVRG